jgi:hypothetical protein
LIFASTLSIINVTARLPTNIAIPSDVKFTGAEKDAKPVDIALDGLTKEY